MEGETMTVSCYLQLESLNNPENKLHPQTTIRATLGKLAMRHFQTLDDLFCCMIFVVSAIAFWYVIAWVVGTVVKLIFPVVIMFVFMVRSFVTEFCLRR